MTKNAQWAHVTTENQVLPLEECAILFCNTTVNPHALFGPM